MRRATLAIGSALLLSGCTLTPEQLKFWSSFARPVEGGPVPCGQWVGTSRVAGFSDAEIRTEHVLMSRESRCYPGAHNPSGASGLMQIMTMWADDCGGSPSQLFDPQFNVSCAKHVKDVQGWNAWSTYHW